MKKNKFKIGLVIILILVIVLIGLWYYLGGIDKNLIGEQIIVRRATVDGIKTDNAAVSLPYTKDSSKYNFVNIAIDLNRDRKFDSYQVDNKTQVEWVVQNMPARVLAAEGNSFSFKLVDKTAEERQNFSLVAVLTRNELTQWAGQDIGKGAIRKITVTAITANEVRPRFKPDPTGERDGGWADSLSPNFALAADEIPNFPPNENIEATKPLLGEGEALSPEKPLAETPPAKFNEFHGDVPDIDQKPNECALTATANSLLWLADKYKFKDKMPATSDELIAELKNDFAWNVNGVIIPTKYIPGKSVFFKRHDIAMETHQVGAPFDPKILAKIAQELKKGQDVEISIEFGFWDAAGRYRRQGGHMVTVVGAHTEADSQFIDIHDPLSPGPNKLDIYEVKGSRIVGYDYQGTATTFIRYAIAESPVVVETPKTLPMPEESGLTISQDNFVFNHQIGITSCPTAIGTVKITSAKEGIAWQLVGNIPSWLNVSVRSGKTPGNLNLSFNCQLTQYVTQTLDGEIKVQLKDTTGNLKGLPRTIKIKGQIKGR